MGRTAFGDRVLAVRGEPLRAAGVSVLQVNLGYRCNLACRHCHVAGGPHRPEMMGEETAAAVLRALRAGPIPTLDLTGGAPELTPVFRDLVRAARAEGRRVIVRTNLAVFAEPGQGDLPEFLREQGVEVVASLPYYLEDDVDRVRGGGTFARCIEGLRRLNGLGYGNGADCLSLSLVYNPRGAFLAPAQETLEAEYRRELDARFGIRFTRLYAFTNQPIGRFRDFLVRTGGVEKYLDRLASAFNPAVLDGVMCRSLVSVGWDGTLSDCDFNQVLGIPVSVEGARDIARFDLEALSRRAIAVDDHCYGCTAGQGST